MANHNQLLTTTSNKGTYVVIRTPPITTYTQGGDLDGPEIPLNPDPPIDIEPREYNISYKSTSGWIITTTINADDGHQKILDDVEVGTTIEITKTDASDNNVRIGVVEGDCELAYDSNIEKGNGESKTVTITQPGKLVIELGGSVNYPKGGQYAVGIDYSCSDYFVIDKRILYVNDQFKVTCVKDYEIPQRNWFGVLKWGSQWQESGCEISGFLESTYKPGDVCIGVLKQNYSVSVGLLSPGGGIL